MFKTLTPFALIIGCTTSIIAQLGLAPQWLSSIENTKGISAQAFYDVIPTANGSVYVGLRSGASGGNANISSIDQAGTVNWETSINTGPHQGSIAQQVQADAAGNFYTWGTQTRGGFMDETFIAKVDAAGNQIWAKTYYGALNKSAEAFDMEVTANAVYLCGSEKDTSFYHSGFLLKYDLSGNLLWSKTYSIGLYNEFFSVTTDATGNIVVVGSADADYSSLVVKYDDMGNVLWQYPSTLTNRNEEQYLTAVTVDNNGNIYATGAEEQNSSFVYDVITLKLSSTGTFTWQENWNNGDINEGRYVKIGSNGSIYVGANKEDSFDYYALLIAYNASGTKLWDADFEFDEDATIEGMYLDASDNIYIGIDDDDSVGVAKFSSGGNLLGSKSYPEASFEYLEGIGFGNNTLLLCGRSFVGNEGVAASLSNTLSQNYFKSLPGTPMSYAKAGAIAGNTTHTYSATYADEGDTVGFEITQMNATTGTLLWTKTKEHKASSQKFEQIKIDAAGAVVGLYEFQDAQNALGIVKYDATGSEIFSTTLTTGGPVRSGQLAVDASNNIYVAGYRQGAQEMFLIKYDATGTQMWEQTYASPSTPPQTLPLKVLVTGLGKVVIGTSNKQANGSLQFEIFQYSSAGNLEWNKTMGGNILSGAELTDMLADAQGNITILGATGFSNYVTEKFDATGGSVWSKSGSLVSTQFPRSLAIDGNGNAYLCFSSSTNYTIRKVDNAGTIVQDKNHNFKSSGGFFFPWYAAWVNGNLAILGSHIFGGIDFPFQALLDGSADVISIQVDSTSSRSVIGGTTDGAGGVYGLYERRGTTLARPWYVSVVQRFNVASIGLRENVFNPYSVSIYPNPITGTFTVKIPEGLKLTEAILMDLNGRKLHQFSISKQRSPVQEHQFELPIELERGNYILQMATGEGTVGKVILVK
ncbi:T9SS type A sorting domain-containing protein [Owenweeksia hongkongensis]|uniref:T9SS type A sorting domain-containing protein n=1 Tax=Owenweeksia hongkongensis TaxID=253245 RepID=UPI003A8F90B3